MICLCTIVAHSQEDNISNDKPMKIKIITPWEDVSIKLVVDTTFASTGSTTNTQEIKAREATYEFIEKSNTGLAADSHNKCAILVIHDPYTKRFSFIDPGHGFYISDSSGLRGYTVGPGPLIWSCGFVEVPDSQGIDFAIRQFETTFDSTKFNEEWDHRIVQRIGLAAAAPRFYFSDDPVDGGGAAVMCKVESLVLTQGILRLDIRNPFTKIPATFWLDLKEKKVTKCIANGEEMDLSPQGIDQRQRAPIDSGVINTNVFPGK